MPLELGILMIGWATNRNHSLMVDDLKGETCIAGKRYPNGALNLSLERSCHPLRVHPAMGLGDRGVMYGCGWVGEGKNLKKKQTGKDGVKKKREFFSWRICLVRDEDDVSHIVNGAPWWFWIVVLLLRGVVGYEKSKMPKYAIDIHVFSMAFGSREKLDVSRMTRPSQTYSFAWDLGG